MRKLIVLNIVALFFLNSCNAQNMDQKKSDTLKFNISKPKVGLNGNTKNLLIHVKLENSLNQALLLYAFKLTQEAKRPSIDYQNDQGSSGTILVISDQDDQQIIPEVIIDFHKDLDEEPVTKEVIQRLLIEKQNEFVSKKVVLKEYSKVEMDVSIDLEYHDLKPGTYSIYLIYHSGKALKNVVSDSVIKADLMECQAELFQGWMKSNTVRLVVE